MSNRSVNSNRSSNRSSSRSVSSANDEVDPTDTAGSRRMSAPGSSSGAEGGGEQSSQSLSAREVYNALDDDLEVDKPKKLFKARELVVSTKELLPSVTVMP